MHIILGFLAIIGTIAFVLYRLRDAREVGGQAVDTVNDVRATVRRLMYKRKHDRHPADQVDDPRLAAAGIAVAIATMDAPASKEELETLSRLSQRIFDVSEQEAGDIVAYGRWISDQCNTAQEAVRRLSKVVAREAGPEAANDLERLIRAVATADGTGLGEEEEDAIASVRRTLGPG